MTDPSPAQLLAAVLRVVAPSKEWIPDSRANYVFGGGGPWGYGATNKDDLARVVAMLTEEQRRIYDRELAARISPSNRVAPAVSCVLPSETMLASTADHLAALVAATGAKA